MMTMNSDVMETTDDKAKLTEKELKQIYVRSCQLDISWNYERQQHMGYSYALTPVIRKLYPGEENKEKRVAALKRGLEFMAITPQLSTLLRESMRQWKRKIAIIRSLMEILLTQ